MIEQLKLLVKEVENEYSQENFKRLQDFINGQPLMKGIFKFFEITYPAAASFEGFTHGLGFQPKDVIMTSVTGGATVTWHYENFDSEKVYITTSTGTTIRVFIGRYEE
jgi:hypothetical protein